MGSITQWTGPRAGFLFNNSNTERVSWTLIFPFLLPGWSCGQTTITTMLPHQEGTCSFQLWAKRKLLPSYYFLSGIWWKTHIRQVPGFSSNLPSNQERAVFLLTCAHIFLSPFWSSRYALCYFSLILVPCSHLCSGPYYSFSFLKVFNAISIAAWRPLSNGPVFCPS